MLLSFCLWCLLFMMENSQGWWLIIIIVWYEDSWSEGFPFQSPHRETFLVNWLFLCFSESGVRRRRVAPLVADLRGGSLGCCSEGKGRSSVSMGFLPSASPRPATPGFCQGWNLFWMRDGSQNRRWVPTRAVGGRRVLPTPMKSPFLGQDERLTQ